MRNAILSTLAALAIAVVPALGADSANNAKCGCGKDVPAESKHTVTIKDGDKELAYRCCSEHCATSFAKMTPAEAKKAFAAHNKVETSPKSGGG